jgi:MFS family permease
VRRFVVDIAPLRASRDLRFLIAGELVAGLGTQAVLVALPFQLYVETRSAFLTGLLGAVELVPLVSMSLLGGAAADRFDRRMMLLLVQIGLIAAPAALAAITFPARRRSGRSTSSAACSRGSTPSRTSCGRRSSPISSSRRCCAPRSR